MRGSVYALDVWDRTPLLSLHVPFRVVQAELIWLSLKLSAKSKVTSIQKLLGHSSIDSTLIYARVHDETVATDYYAAMSRIEKSLEISIKMEDIKEPNNDKPVERTQLLVLIDQLAVPQLGVEVRLDLVTQMRHLLNGQTPEPMLAVAC